MMKKLFIFQKVLRGSSIQIFINIILISAGRSAQKMPIRNLHKLLESPQRTARKRLDSLYDRSKPKKNVVPTTVGRVQALSAKKPVQKPAAPAAASESQKSVSGKIGPSKQIGTENQRRSRLLPPGTITGSYVDKRNSLAPRNLYKPLNSRFTLNVKKPGSKRPSDVPEESPQALETSGNSAEDPGKLPGLSFARKTEKTEDANSQNDKGAAPLCSRCSRFLDESANASVLLNENDKITEKAKDDPVPRLQGEDKRNEEQQRPTVIVTRTNEDCLGLAEVAPQDGSYSEILSLQQQNQRRSTESNETMLFKQTENALTRSENPEESNEDKTEFVFEMLNANKSMLIWLKSSLETSISQQEKQLKSVNERLEKQKTLENGMKSKRLGKLDEEKLALLVSQGVEDKSTKVLGENFEANKPEAAKPKRGRKSRSETRSKETEDPEASIENIENEPPQRRRSARLAMKQGDVSLPIQHSTPVTGKKKAKESMAKSKPCTPVNTPAKKGQWGRRSERPLREYMVLKSAIKFLNTPDSRRYKIGSDEKVEVLGLTDHANQEVQLTDKLLKELHELYSTP